MLRMMRISRNALSAPNPPPELPVCSSNSRIETITTNPSRKLNALVQYLTGPSAISFRTISMVKQIVNTRLVSSSVLRKPEGMSWNSIAMIRVLIMISVVTVCDRNAESTNAATFALNAASLSAGMNARKEVS